MQIHGWSFNTFKLFFVEPHIVLCIILQWYQSSGVIFWSWLSKRTFHHMSIVVETLHHVALCFTDSVSAAIFFVLLEFVFTAHMRLWLSIHNALTSIKLWHFSQITWAAISCFNTVTPQSMWVKDTIRDLSIKSVPTWDVFVVWRRDWTWTSELSGRIVCFISFWNMKLKYLVFLKGIWMLHAGESDMFTVFIVKKMSLAFLTFFFNHKNLVPTLPTMQRRYVCNWT